MSKEKAKFSWLSTILTSAVVVLGILVVNYINTYGQIKKSIFIYVNIGFVIFALLLILITIKVNNTNKKSIRAIFVGSLAIVLGFSSYAYYLTSIADSNIKQITTQDDETTYEAAFVAKNGKFKSVEQLKGKTIGIIDSDEFIEGNVLPKDELKKLEYDNNKVKMYHSYPLLINALIKDEVDFISLPKEYKTLYVTDEQIVESLDEIETVHTFSGNYASSSIISASNVKVTEEPFTMLIMGNDGGRTDSLMLASVNPKSMQITLTSIARDSYVPIACYPNQSRDKINHARQVSRECTIKTVENLLDIQIDFFVEISFMGLVDLVDALGTITIDSPAAFNGNIEREGGGGVHIPAGVSELNGDQVLAFVRERKTFLNGDFQRQMNQQQAIGSLINKIAATRNPKTLINIVEATGKNVETNLSLSQLIDLMNLALVRMESTYLNSSEIVTIYGNRITGQGTQMYSPAYGFPLYYYVLYDGSINDAKALIAMNMRSDNILEIPKGFNYSAKDSYVPPTFGKDEYYEAIDESIFKDAPQAPSDDQDDEDESLVHLIELYGMTREDADKYLKQYGFSAEYILNKNIETIDNDLVGKTVIKSKTTGISLDKNNSVISLKYDIYVYPPNPQDEEKEEEVEEEDKSIQVNALYGMTAEQAESYLSGLGLLFKSNVVKTEFTEDKDKDGTKVVVSHNSAFTAMPGTTITFEVIEYKYKAEE